MDSLKAVLKSEKNDTNKVNSLNILSEKLWKTGKSDTSIACASSAEIIAEKVRFKKGMAKAYHNMGVAYMYKGNYIKALEFYSKALKTFEDLKDRRGIASNTGNIGIVYYFQGDYPKALEFYFNALKMDEELGDKSGTAKNTSNIGIVYKEQGDYAKALDYYFKALKMCEAMGDKRGTAINTGSIANVYYVEADYPKALEFYFKALKMDEEIGDKMSMASHTGNIGNVYMYKGDYQKALEYDFKSRKMYQELGDEGGKARISCCIGLVFTKQKDYALAKSYLDSSLTLSKNIGEKEYIKSAYNGLYSLDSSMGNYKKALEDYKQSIIYRDSLVNEANTKKSVQTEMNFEFEQKQATEKAEQDKKDAIAEQDRNKQKVIRNSFIGGFVLMLALAFFIFRGYRQKQKANLVISSQKTVVEEKQKEILDSIHYAQRIQKALLASDALLSKNLPEYFVMYKPKDIVSGDFYWATAATPHPNPFPQGGEGNRFYLAVCDSTGHGVPGAFMSLLNISFLNEAITEKNINKPNEVLNHVRKRLIENISQDGGQDGMDGVVASLHPSEGGTLLMYAAAYNTPLVVRNKEVIELSNDKMPVGASPMENIPFTNQTFDLQKGDTLYLFTDGYADQFGGPKGKKFKYKQLQEKVLAISHQPLAEQKDILEQTFDKWKGMLEQVDDVLVIGIRV